MRSTKLAVSIGLAVLALLVVVRLATHRAPPTPRPSHPALDAGRPLDAAVDVPAPDVPVRVDVVIPPRDVPPIDPRRVAIDNRRRDQVATQTYRALLQHGARVTSVQAVVTHDGMRDNLRVRGASCTDRVDRDLAQSGRLRESGYSLVTCVNPATGDTFVTGIPEQMRPDLDAGPVEGPNGTVPRP